MPHLAALLRVARRLTPEPASAEDLVQETMLLLCMARKFRGFQSRTNARAWLFRIMFNVFHGQSRREFRSPEFSSSGFRPMFQEAVEIAEALNALSLEQRTTVLLLCVVEGFTCREAAGILDLPIGTVMSRLSRARQELRESLAPMAKEAYR